eukprot:CAMPEP_0195047236 /NCGR_PEP_ID=MMETSP0347-20130606/34418_1 /TAXON_ID=2932 /ORGANISM="Alexandrium fundyense, Strain CCMP1719" /LENGTH=45 /DNA_ID= /DNA_START= /DNA_END= /DNA_ORIENTATION=
MRTTSCLFARKVDGGEDLLSGLLAMYQHLTRIPQFRQVALFLDSA